MSRMDLVQRFGKLIDLRHKIVNITIGSPYHFKSPSIKHRTFKKEGKLLYELLEDTYFFITLDVGGKTVILVSVLPKGFIWDGASIPPILRGVIDPADCFFAASGHDFDYHPDGSLHIWSGVDPDLGDPLGEELHYDRMFADVVFLRGLKYLDKLDIVRRRSCYLAVRKFGGAHFEKDFHDFSENEKKSLRSVYEVAQIPL